jgi:hypothetical protein
MFLPSGRDGFATGTQYHDVHRNKPTTSGISTAHTFDYPANWLLYHPQKGMPGNAAFHSTIKIMGFQTAFFVHNPDLIL